MATKFELVRNFKGYINKADITNVQPGFLVRGSRNVISTDGERVAIRKGYTLDGQANTSIGGIRNANDWQNLLGQERHVRNFGNTMQFRYVAPDGTVTWNTLTDSLASRNVSYPSFEWWNTDQLIATMLFVDGGTSIKEWNGGITTFASATASTITKQGILTGTTISFADTNPDTILDSANGFVTAGFQVGETITVNGSTSNDGEYTIAAVTAGTITIATDESLTVEAAGANITLSTTGTWAENGFYKSGVVSAEIVIDDFSAITSGAIVEVTINGTTTNLTEGTDWNASTDNDATAQSLSSAINALTGVDSEAITNSIFIDRAGETDVINNIVVTPAGGITIPTTFPPSGQINIGGTTYTYTGGETTGTLTGVTPNPTLGGHTAGDLSFQEIREYQNSDISGLPTATRHDVIEILENQVYVGGFSNRFVYISHVNNFLNFSFSDPRVVGEGARLTLGGDLRGMTPQEGVMYFSAGRDNWYRSRFELGADTASERLKIEQLKTNPGEGALSTNSIQKIKNSVVYISNEPALNTLGRLEELETPQTKNFSDPIKIDFDNLDFTEASIIYFKYDIYIALPREDLVLIYNIERSFWEAPQILPISAWSIIDGELFGHSSQVPETYKMFNGTSDRAIVSGGTTTTGNAILAIAAFSYQNFGDRTTLKNFNEWYTEGYMSRNSTLDITLNYELNGCEQIIGDQISGTEDRIFCEIPNDAPLGKLALGKNGLGNGSGIVDETQLPKIRAINSILNTDFYEMQVVYSSNDIDFQWELLAFGPAIQAAGKDNPAIKI